MNDSRPFAPLDSTHWLIGTECSACNRPFDVGDVATLVALGPGSDDVECGRARAGRPYNARAVTVHWVCATGSDDPVRDWNLYAPPESS